MAVKDVFSPKPVNQIDPKRTEEKPSEWKRKAEDAKLEREYLEEQKRIERMSQPEMPPEPQFQVRGGVNIDIDPQRDTKEAREAAEKIRQEKDNEIKTEKEKREKADDQRRKAEDELKKTELTVVIKELTGEFKTALKDMNTKIDDVKAGADPSGLLTQFNALEQVAKKITDIRAEGGGGFDPRIQLEITKLNMENARAEREFQASMQERKERWEAEKIKMQEDRYFKQQELERQLKRDDMFAKGPEIFGRAFAEGIKHKGPTQPSQQPSSSGKSYRIEAGVGEAGVTDCVHCEGKSTVAVGPTAKNAVCGDCGTRFSITRTKRQEPAAAEYGEEEE